MIYRTKIMHPDPIREYFETLIGPSGIHDLSPDFTEILIEAEDDYELSTIVRELTDTINSQLGYGAVEIPRPVEFEE